MKTFEEKMEAVRLNPIRIDQKFFENLSENTESLSRDLIAACNAYETDIRERQANLDAQTVQARAQIQQLATQREKLMAMVTDATSRADLDAAAGLEAELEAVEKQISGAERKVRLANSAELKGNPALFQAAERASIALAEDYNARRAAYSECYTLLKPVIEARETLLETLLWRTTNQFSVNGESSYRQVSAHFHEEAKRKAEMEAIARAEQEQAAQTHRNLCIH